MQARNLLLASALASFALSAPALEVSESTVNTAASLVFPRTVKHIEVRNPVIELRDGLVHFCAEAQPAALKLPVHFCAAGRPVWHADTAILTGSDFVLEDVSAKWLKPSHGEHVRQVLNDAVLPALRDVKLYEAKNWVGRQVKAVTVNNQSVNLKF